MSFSAASQSLGNVILVSGVDEIDDPTTIAPIRDFWYDCYGRVIDDDDAGGANVMDPEVRRQEHGRWRGIQV